MAVLSGVRGQTIQFLDINEKNEIDDVITLRVTKKTKTCKPGKHPKPLSFRRYPHDVDMCVVSCLFDYIDHSATYRPPDVTQLFICHGTPHGAAARATIAR